MPRHRPDPIDPLRLVDLTGGSPHDILSVLDDLVAEGQGLAADEVRALRDSLAEAIDALDTTSEEPDAEGYHRRASALARGDGVYLDVAGLAEVWSGLGHLIGVGEA